MNLRRASMVATGVLVLTVFGLLALHALFANRPVLIGVQVLALAWLLWARIIFGMRSFHYAANPTEGGLVTSGPYRLVRHPIYAAVLFIVWAGVASHASPLSVVLGIVASAATAVRIASEEKLVTERYPEYAAYAARTKRIIPFLV